MRERKRFVSWALFVAGGLLILALAAGMFVDHRISADLDHALDLDIIFIVVTISPAIAGFAVWRLSLRRRSG